MNLLVYSVDTEAHLTWNYAELRIHKLKLFVNV